VSRLRGVAAGVALGVLVAGCGSIDVAGPPTGKPSYTAVPPTPTLDPARKPATATHGAPYSADAIRAALAASGSRVPAALRSDPVAGAIADALAGRISSYDGESYGELTLSGSCDDDLLRCDLQAKGVPLGVAGAVALPRDEAEATGPFTAERLTITIMLIAASAAVGTALARWTENPVFTLPTFVWTLLVGAVLRNGLAVTKVHVVDGQALAFAGTVALSLFLAMALMSLRLWELASLALPMLVILTLQALAVAAYTSFITFRVMGANYEAAVLVAGQCGFGLGATPTAIANIQAVCSRYGAAPQAFILVPVVGAFLIDVANAIVISLFVNIIQMMRN